MGFMKVYGREDQDTKDGRGRKEGIAASLSEVREALRAEGVNHFQRATFGTLNYGWKQIWGEAPVVAVKKDGCNPKI